MRRLQHWNTCFIVCRNQRIWESIVLLPVDEESDKDAMALLATCGFLKTFVECLIDLVCSGVNACRAQALLNATKDPSYAFVLNHE